MNIFKFSDIFAEMKTGGWWLDFINIDRVIVECHSCPACHKTLEYKGYANATNAKTFGVCRTCDYAKLFYETTSGFAKLKQQFSRREMAVNK